MRLARRAGTSSGDAASVSTAVTLARTTGSVPAYRRFGISRELDIPESPALSGTHGFTLFEVVVALAVTMTMIGSVFGLMAGGQTTFRRETQVADMQMSTRAGLQLLSHDLAMAGYRTPPASAIIWADSGGLQPDEITIVYADSDVPLSQPIECGGAGGPCGTIGQSSTLLLDPEAEDLTLATAENAYEEGMVLAAIELADCNNDGQVGILPFLVTQPPTITNAGGFPTLRSRTKISSALVYSPTETSVQVVNIERV